MKKIIAATLIAAVMPTGAAFADNQVSRGFDEGLTYVETGVSVLFTGLGQAYDALDKGLEHTTAVENALK